MKLEDVRDIVDSEGFDYGFRFYSEFLEVEDEEFHRRRAAYVEAARELDDYLPHFDEEGGA